MYNFQTIKPDTHILPKEGIMRVPGLIICPKEDLQEEAMQKAVEQVKNVATLPGIVGYSIAMPDIHWGYGFPIGGIAAMDIEHGVISPGGVGYDINCGVRLALAPLKFEDLSEQQKEQLLQKIFMYIPSGTGEGQKEKKRSLSATDYKNLTSQGARWSIEQGYGFSEDLEHMESRGVLEGADIRLVSNRAQERGRNQLGSIGSGNHFVEIGEIQEIFSQDIASLWGLHPSYTYILIHSGSRGFGHQICQDTLTTFLQKGFAKDLPDKQLVAAPLKSPEGKQYWATMAAAANYAFNNRQQILHGIRKAFQEVCMIPMQEIRLLYDICHNIAKIESHEINGTIRKLCVHRKGATRAYAPGAEELSPLFQKVGQPVFIPGDMGRASFVMAGLGNPLTWCSACHGAGREKSRIKSRQAWQGRSGIAHMKTMGVHVVAHSNRTITEEMPDAYKNVERVVSSVENANLAQKIAKLRPRLVLKG